MTKHVSDDEIDSIVGHFLPIDVDLFRLLLHATADNGPGDLAELGVLYGRSAVLIGASLRDGETFTVVDLFGADPGDAHNAAENDQSYPGLTRVAFEDNYRRLLGGELPTIVQGLSHTVVDHARHRTHRFVHVDASHLHANVVRDIEAARTLLAPQGVLVLDDIRSEHTPGVAAAAWQAVLTADLRPFAISPFKLYATFGDPAPWVERVSRWAIETGHPLDVQVVNGRDLARVTSAHQRPPHPIHRYVPPAAWPAVRRIALAVGMRRRPG